VSPAALELELAESDLRRLVRLRVRPQLDVVRVGVRLEIGEVRLESVEVDNGDGLSTSARKRPTWASSNESVRSAPVGLKD